MLEEVGRFATLVEAQIVAGLLRSHGVNAEVPDAHYGSTEPYLAFAIGWFRVCVPAAEAVTAREVLSSTEPLADDEQEAGGQHEPVGIADRLTFAFSLVISWWAGAPMVRKRWRFR